ncbi:hypothetical protein R3P38DRAFT_2903568 [Favolaschia claudopus]|uniref:Uncharacterized protein n=1 Tax=Favolaschia claudopus TaxID=2862362 RepID=A0AAW0CCR5_9AGAR
MASSQDLEPTGLLSLPPEIRLQIWKPVLQLTPADAIEHFAAMGGYVNAEIFEQLKETSYIPSACCPGVESKPPHLLQVCRLINTEATPLLYDNTLVVITPTGEIRHNDLLAGHAKLVTRLRQSRSSSIRRVLVFVHSGNYYRNSEEVATEDAPLIADLCEALAFAAQGTPLDWLHVHVVDWTISEVFGRNTRALGVKLLRGIGLLTSAHTQISMMTASGCDQLEWASRQSGRTIPLAWIHKELEACLNKYDSDDVEEQGDDNNVAEKPKAGFLRKSLEAAEQLNEEAFFVTFESALESVAGRAPEDELARLRALRRGEDSSLVLEPIPQETAPDSDDDDSKVEESEEEKEEEEEDSEPSKYTGTWPPENEQMIEVTAEQT